MLARRRRRFNLSIISTGEPLVLMAVIRWISSLSLHYLGAGRRRSVQGKVDRPDLVHEELLSKTSIREGPCRAG